MTQARCMLVAVMLVAVRFCGCPNSTSSSEGKKVVVASSSGLFSTMDTEATNNTVTVIRLSIMMAFLGLWSKGMAYTTSITHIVTSLKEKHQFQEAKCQTNCAAASRRQLTKPQCFTHKNTIHLKLLHTIFRIR